MATVRIPARTTAVAARDCGCGCGKVESRCCGLECLVRPNFYCGQLLTDADLAVMVQWSRDRFALSRYRDGWGIVCGLELTCSAPTDARDCGCGCGGGSGTSGLWVGAGYAVDCCGNDLVVCEPIPVDLGSLCLSPDDPCADPCPPVVVREGEKEEGETVNLSGLRIPRRELIVADVVLRYAEQPTTGQRPMFRGNCADLEACEPTRIRELPCAVLVPSDDDPRAANPQRDSYEEDLRKQYQRQIAAILELVRITSRETLLRRLKEWPIYNECFVVEWLRAQKEVDEEIRKKLGSFLLLDWVSHMNVCACRTCRTDLGVPLGRVVLWRKYGRAECCRTLVIRGGTAFRRELSRDCAPRPTDKTDMVGWIGMRATELEGRAVRDGIDVRPVEAPDPVNRIAEPIFAARAGDVVRAHVVTDLLGERRIVGFERGPK